ncbi:MAG TPA: phosphate signaling complex protein PhoU, partial [Thermoanaerobaculia bacterium]|nr:phosphate signaling complex protein PhoU [Thermoanaerobaculia bacterium]
MERHRDQDLEQIRKSLLRMGGLVERQIREAMQALVERDGARADAVIRSDDEVDQLQKDIDGLCSRMLALQQPMATDLRFLVATMKIATDLERMGDSAVNVAQAVGHLNQEPPLQPYLDLPRLAQITQEMVRDALDSFVRRDARAAIEVCKRDDEVDGLYHQLFRELVTYMVEDPRNITRALHLLLVARNYERIADHATNVGEDVVFYVEGRDIRHQSSPAKSPEPA